MIGNAAIAGVWKLTGYKRRFLDTGEVRSDMLPHAYIRYPVKYMSQHLAQWRARMRHVRQ